MNASHPSSHVRIKVSMWYCVMVESRSQSIVIRESATSLVDDSRVLYQSKDARAAEKQAALLACSTGTLYCKPCAPPSVDSRGRAIDHDRKPLNAHKSIDPMNARRVAYAWEKV
jgi:hypothetical protein